MRRPAWATRPVLFLALVAVVAGAVVVIVALNRGSSAPPKPLPGVASDRAATIPAPDGISLAAEVITPRGAGPFPLVVMPASWGSGATEYRQPGSRLAAAGYQVVAYAQRGFPASGGVIDYAAPTTQRDVSTVIDWALTHTRADKAKIGLVGISYGAGMSLLAAARDSRIKAVVAMSGWSDLVGSLAPNATPNIQSMHLLLDSRLQNGTLVGAVRDLAASLSGPAAGTTSVLDSMTAERSADTVVAALNRNRPAIMLANAYEDSILDPSPLVSFFDALTTPKRWQLAPGDHGGPEGPALYGKPSRTFTDATAWLDHYLRGRANGIDKEEPIELVDGVTGARHAYRVWPAATTFQLGPPNTSDDVVSAGGGGGDWTQTLTTGTDSGATTGPGFVGQPNPYRPPTIAAAAVNPAAAWIWTAAPVAQRTVISGSPHVSVAVTSSTPTTTLYAYLYDVAPDGTATLMSYAPETTPSGTASFVLRPTSWTVRAGDHLMLAIDTVDPRFASAAPSGSSLTLSSSAAAPAALSLPLG